MPNQFDQLIDKTQRRLALLKSLRDHFEDDPSFEKILRQTLAESNGVRPKANRRTSQQPSTEPTLFRRTQAFLASRNNEWVTASEIQKETEKARGTVGVMLYKTNAGDFESRLRPGSKKIKQWRMKREVSL